MPATSLAASPFLSPPSAARLRASCVWPIQSRTSPCRAATRACAASARSGCRTVPTVAHQFSSGCMHAWSDFGVHLSSIYKMGGRVSQHTYMPGRYMLLYPPQKGCAASRVASRNAALCAWAWPVAVRVGRRWHTVCSGIRRRGGNLVNVRPPSWEPEWVRAYEARGHSQRVWGLGSGVPPAVGCCVVLFTFLSRKLHSHNTKE